MLTSDLLRVRRKGGRVLPRYLRGDDAELAKTLAKDFVRILGSAVGHSRDEIEAALDAVPVPADARLVGDGLRKVLDGQCTWTVPAGVDPEEIRREVFLAAALAHRALDVRSEFDRDAVLAELAPRLGKTPAEIDAALYADLRENERLEAFRPIGPDALLERYDLGLAQAVLLKATRVTIRVADEGPDRYRRLFRAARFHGLIHVVEGSPQEGYTITLDGPWSLFDAVQKYGLRLAMFLPQVLAFRSFHVRAELAWGKAKTRAVLEITPEDGLVSHVAEAPSTGPDLDVFKQAFERLGSEWVVTDNDHVFALPGEIACVPDLVFRSETTGEEVFLEAFGFWSRQAVWQRVELVRKGFPARFLLAVGKQLRVSEEVLGEDEAGEIYVYRATMSPRAVLERLRRKG
ncbi:DUF790 family protein [Polyangium sorediatum]|uniref:DUF790 family protein n=1 Tax=Polyangium sorediatum TaxID=889274 RepID=A0ABT6NSF1_9BACT|nr:DUF790 family protein [Polyangium sorediatum]MDI1431256.1 DUF790 family protein [Polyangium sorediatum]